MKKIVLSLIAVLGMLLGFVAGARFGTYEFTLATAQYNASLLTYQIKALKAGKSQAIIEAMEISLNGELAKHGRYLESHLTWLWPELRSPGEDAIRMAVAYRLANPYQRRDLSEPASWQEGVDMESEVVKHAIERQMMLQHHVAKVLTHYGSMTDDKALQLPPKSGAAGQEP
jgi:hypothetical protein